jgi:hypothetical protein
MNTMSLVTIAVLAAVLAAGAFVWGSYRAEMTRARRCQRGCQGYDHIFWSDRVCADRQRHPLLSIHGAGGGFEFTAANIPHAKLIIYDAVGHLLVGHDRLPLIVRACPNERMFRPTSLGAPIRPRDV